MNEGRFSIAAAELYGRFAASARQPLIDEKRRVEAATPGQLGFALFWRRFRRWPKPIGGAADPQANETLEARKARIRATVNALFEAPHPDEFRFRYW